MGEGDRVDMAAVIGLAGLGAAPIAEEALRLREGAATEVLEIRYPGAMDALGDITGQVEHRVPRALGGQEETLVFSIGRLKTRDEFGADLVVRLVDRGTKRRK